MNKPAVHRTTIRIEPDASRVLIRPFIPHPERIVRIMARIAAQPDEEVKEHLDKIFADFSSRHIETTQTFLERYESLKQHHFSDLEPSYERKLLIGSYFTSEYSLESAALFNPSIVPHPDQSEISQGSVRFIMSLRAVGEGHLSSVAFRCGTISEDHEFVIDKPTRFVVTPEPVINKEFSKKILSRKFSDLGFFNEYVRKLFRLLPDTFTFGELEDAIKRLHNADPGLSKGNKKTQENLLWLARSNYDVRFDPAIPLGGRAIFPYSPSEKQGIEDVRFVRFSDEDQSCTYYGTATAWDGSSMVSQLIETEDFLTFKVSSLNGEAVENKGMALFPRKIEGKYAMISRQDNENIHLMYSDHIQFWRESRIIIKPAYPWEYYQMGNCGSPMETERGWLLITHGVGAMRRYAMGAVLLDRDDPAVVLGRTREPILVPNENEREGYVPNVVYSCGSMIHNGKLVLPYAMADQASRIALVDLEELMQYILAK